MSNNRAAFPSTLTVPMGSIDPYTGVKAAGANQVYVEVGISVRDYFAAASIPPLRDKLSHPGDVAREAYKLADAMLKARNA